MTSENGSTTVDLTKADLWEDWNALSHEERNAFYDKWSENYEKDVDQIEYHHPKLMSQIVIKLIEENNYSKETVRILDIACGVGYFSKYIREFGISNIDGLDASEGMLKEAKKLNRYVNYFHESVSSESLKTVEKGAYDIVYTSGSFTYGHLNAKCLSTIAELVKSGGLYAMAMRKVFLTKPEFEDVESTIQEMCDKGVWKLVRKEIIEKYHEEHPGMLFILQKC